MRNRMMCVAVALAAALFVAAVFGPATVLAQDEMGVQSSAPLPAQAQADLRLPLQQALAGALAVHGASSSAGPADVQFRSEVEYVDADAAGQVQSYMLTGTTVVSFDNPQQAGLDAWPAIVVSDAQIAGATGEALPGDYSVHVREWLAGELPGIWDLYEFGQEPRRYTFTEHITVTLAEPEAATSYAGGGMQAVNQEKDVLVGFATSGPDWDYVLEDSWETCLPIIGCATVASIRAGFELNWDIGFHLPIAIDQTAQRPMVLGSNPISVTMRGLDWTPQQLSDQPFDLAGDDEFVLSAVLFAGVEARVAGVSVVDPPVDVDFETSESFATPMGQGETFPIPREVFPASSIGTERGVSGILTFGIGLSLDPDIITDGVKAEWSASQEGQGSGSLHYTAAGVPQEYGTITGVDLIRDLNRTVVTLDNIEYTFQSFGLGFGACPEFDLFGFGDTRVCIDVGRGLSLESLFGGLHVPPFSGEDYAITHAFGVQGTHWAYLPTLRERQ